MMLLTPTTGHISHMVTSHEQKQMKQDELRANAHLWLHIGTPYRGKDFWTHQIHTSCLSTLLIFIHIEHICSFSVTFLSGTIDTKNILKGRTEVKQYTPLPLRGTGV
jgi:hypothetical protein